MCWKCFQRSMRSPSHSPSAFEISNQVSMLSMNMIRSCSLQYGYSFKLENNGYFVYMNNTFHGHAPYVNGSLNLGHGDTHVHAKRCRVNNDSTTFSWHCC